MDQGWLEADIENRGVTVLFAVATVCSKFTGKHPDDDEHTIP